MLKALIDSDLLVYRVGFTTEDVEVPIAQWRTQEMINNILDALKIDDYTCYLTSTDKSNFRLKIFGGYKANRKQPKPKHYDALRDYLIKDHKAIVVEGKEADDQLGIDQTNETVICTIDKDLDQIPGWHYNFVKGLLYEVSAEEGLRYFYKQLLMGDRTDNIPGLYGIGPVKAEKILNGFTTEWELWQTVLREWQKQSTFNIEDVILSGRLLKIQTRADEGLWEPPQEPQS